MSEADELDLAALARLGIAADPVASPRPGESALDALSREGRITRAQVLAARSWVTRHAARCTCQRLWISGEACPGCGTLVGGAVTAPAAAARGRLRCGARLGALELLEELGRGAAGVVYRARHHDLGRDVALKVVETVANPRRQRRLQREVEALGRLSHPGIVSIHAVHEQPRGLAIEMELVPGKTLARLVFEGGVLPWREAVRLVAQMARALEYAHGEGVLHRDLKPENVLIREDGAAVITDFGVSRLTDQASSLTAAGAVIGTPLYMAPEAFMGEFGTRSDVYGLGSILHCLLCGHPRFHDVESVPELLPRISRGDAEPLDVPGAPADLARVVARAVHADPEQRYPEAADLALDLERLVRGESTSASGVGGLKLPPRALPVGALVVLVVMAITLIVLALAVDPPAPPQPPLSDLERALRLLAAPGEGTPRARATAASRLGAALDVKHADHEALVAGLERLLSSGPGAPELHRLRARLAVGRREPLRVVDLVALARAGDARAVEESCQAAVEGGTRPPLSSTEARAAARDLGQACPDSRAARWLLGVVLCAGGDPADHDAAALALSDAVTARSLRAVRAGEALRVAKACCEVLERSEAPKDGGRALALALEALLSDPELKLAPAVVLAPLTATARRLALEGRALDYMRPQVLVALVRVFGAGQPGLRPEQRALHALVAENLDEFPEGYVPPAAADMAEWSDALARSGDPLLAAKGFEFSVRYQIEREAPSARPALLVMLERLDRAAALAGPLPPDLSSYEAQLSMKTQHRLALGRSRVYEELASLAPSGEREEDLRRALLAAQSALAIVDRYDLSWRKDIDPDTVIRLSLLLGEIDAAARLVPRSTVPRALGADLLRLRGRPAEAIAAAEAALADPALAVEERADLTAVRILALADGGRLDEARGARVLLDQALVADPGVLLEAWTPAAVARHLER